ncbi:sigma 54-interacting transcriptional regulator [Gottfriedia acidiceleris]|uniref:sigma 54-interacting transcriptional regulator n=1 Tax=Gottfriedia acidiceleris TaxID=371036 RepID=UPI003D23D7F7
MLIREVMNREIKTLSLNSTLREAVQIFQSHKIGLLPVVDANNKLLGAFSKSSLYRALLNDFSLDTYIEEHIIREVFTLKEDNQLVEVSDFFMRHQTAHAIVVTRDNHVSGIFGQAEINRMTLLKYNSVVTSLNSINHMHIGAIAIDEKGKIVLMNPAAESMCGSSLKLCMGLSLSDLFPELQDLISSIDVQTEEPLLRHVTLGDKKFLINCNFLSEDHYSWRGLILLQDIKDYETIASELELTHQLQQALHSVIDTNSDGYVWIDVTGQIRMINQAACEFVRLPKDRLIGQPVHHSFPELRLEEMLAEGIPTKSIEAVMLGKHHCLIERGQLRRGNQIIGAVAHIMYRNLNKWKTVINRLDNLEKEVSYYRAELSILGGLEFDLDDILSNNYGMTQLKTMARQAAPGFSNILLLGESGTGKELFARGIHNASRRHGKFVKINCAAVPFELWESEFFGYAEGAFTGAKRGGKKGKFEEANNGTIFLDEIGDMPLSMQVKLLRVLQEREFERVGGNQTIRVNVRIIAATNKNLEQMVASGEFREDLFYRLNVIPLQIPALRDRSEDIPLIAQTISKKFSHMMGIEQITFSRNALSLLMEHQWPGNVRELENVIERAMNCMNGTLLESEHLPDYIKTKNTGRVTITTKVLSGASDIFANQENGQNSSFKKKVSDAEREAIESALLMANGNRTAAAKLLGISRSQFYKKMKILNM